MREWGKITRFFFPFNFYNHYCVLLHENNHTIKSISGQTDKIKTDTGQRMDMIEFIYEIISITKLKTLKFK